MAVFIILAIAGGYVIGSCPTAYLVVYRLRHFDIRECGDGNMGAMNVVREVGFWPGALVAVVDIGKGAAAIAIAKGLGVSDFAVLLTGLAVVTGHAFPFLLQWRGGVGAATALGVLLVLLPREVSILASAAALPLLATANANLFFGLSFGPLFLVALLFGEPRGFVAYSVGLPVLVGTNHLIHEKAFHFRQRTALPPGP